jgi:phage host-nuclease inhibitor protein Gam
MALTKEVVVDKIEVVGEFRHVQVRTATRVLEDGVVLSSSYHRHVVAPGADISGETQEVQDVCNAVHTQAVKDAYAAHLASQEMNGE